MIIMYAMLYMKPFLTFAMRLMRRFLTNVGLYIGTCKEDPAIHQIKVTVKLHLCYQVITRRWPIIRKLGGLSCVPRIDFQPRFAVFHISILYSLYT